MCQHCGNLATGDLYMNCGATPPAEARGAPQGIMPLIYPLPQTKVAGRSLLVWFAVVSAVFSAFYDRRVSAICLFLAAFFLAFLIPAWTREASIRLQLWLARRTRR